MRYWLLLAFVVVAVPSFADEALGPPPPLFAKAEGIVLTTVASSLPATLTTGPLGKCKRFVSSIDGTVTNTCDISATSLVIGNAQTVTVTKTQVIEVKKSIETGKPYVVYWFVGKASLPEGIAARVVVSRHEGSNQLAGHVELGEVGPKTPVFLEVAP